jgi:hypothetical protein
LTYDYDENVVFSHIPFLVFHGLAVSVLSAIVSPIPVFSGKIVIRYQYPDEPIL